MDKPASRHFSVLIIDDEPQVTSELRELLENSGYRCVTSTHRESAIASFQADPNIGLVICDLYLGQDNGIRLIESLKEVAGNGRFFESIILTGHDGRQEVIEAMRVAPPTTTRNRWRRRNCCMASNAWRAACTSASAAS